ncbi:hypothetical protein Leryth_024013, partial [Lithospermum erythrorhizon]
MLQIMAPSIIHYTHPVLSIRCFRITNLYSSATDLYYCRELALQAQVHTCLKNIKESGIIEEDARKVSIRYM